MRGFYLITTFLAGLFMASTALADPPDSYADIADRGYRSDVPEIDTFKCVILEIRPDGNLKVQDEADERKHVVELDEKVPIVARFKKDFNGRKKLQGSDLRVGHRIEVTHVAETEQVQVVKVLRTKKGKGYRQADGGDR